MLDIINIYQSLAASFLLGKGELFTSNKDYPYMFGKLEERIKAARADRVLTTETAGLQKTEVI